MVLWIRIIPDFMCGQILRCILHSCAARNGCFCASDASASREGCGENNSGKYADLDQFRESFHGHLHFLFAGLREDEKLVVRHHSSPATHVKPGTGPARFSMNCFISTQ